MRRRTAFQLFSRALLCLVLGFSLASCSINSSTTLSKQENTLRIPWYGSPKHFDPGIFDPAKASSATSLLVASIENAGLVKFSPDLHVIPELAVSIPTISTDGRSYTFTIRQDARYADGRPCTAADVEYSFARALSPAEHSPLAARYLGGIEGAPAVEQGRVRTLSGVRILHRLTIRIRLHTADATFLEKLAFPVAAIVSRRDSGGLGPFRQAHSRDSSSLEFVQRPHYFGEQLAIDAIRLTAVRNAATGLEMYRKGLLDVAWIPPSRMSTYSNHAEFSESNGLDGYYAVAPSSEGAALASSLDRELLLKTAGPELASLESVVPSAVPDYVSSPPTLSASAVPWSSTPVRLRVAQPHDQLLQALRASLAQQWPSRITATPTVWIVHSTFFLPDPGRWLSIIANQAPSWYRARLTQADTLTNDPVTRMSTYSEIETWALTRGIIIPLATGTLAYLMKSSVQGLNLTAAGLMPVNNTWSSVVIT